MDYLMESGQELERLLAQARVDQVRERLLAAGLQPGQVALDAGCGPGLVALTMADIVGTGGRVLGIDRNLERLGVARQVSGARSNVVFQEGDVHCTGLPEESFDFTWSQFVFEYLARPEAALRELIRVTRRGGRVVVCDIDGAGFANWPFSSALEGQLERAMEALRPTGFDVRVGRKMFHHFRRAGLRDVRVRVHPFYVIAGQADERMVRDWEVRFATAEKIAAPALGGVEAWRAFSAEYISLLKDPETLKYAVVLVTEGVRP